MEPIPAPDDGRRKVLVVTNDSSVFLKNGAASAFEMFGGRLTEVKNLVARLDDVCDVSFGIITGRFGFVPANYVILPYKDVPDSRDDYRRVQDQKDYAGRIEYVSRGFDRIVVCVPKDMLDVLIEECALPMYRVIAVAAPEHERTCRDMGWEYLPRVGARVGRENADAIIRMISDS
ncbi:MAG: hypothetical protein RBQ77_05640 [Candidatus Methanomethylophilaceae archaeon]|jgi:hypothetical protein|nr:hypothetical protein [Candidatus Methanomethylophilaceae archaeon]